MKKDVIILKCKECGEEFLYDFSGRGAKPSYCEKCKPMVTARNKQKYKEKHKLFHYQKVEQSQEKEPVESTTEYDGFIGKMLDLFRELDGLRVNLCSLATELNQYQSSYDKNDQYFLHSLENVNIEDANKAQEFLKMWKGSRNNRRNVKDLIVLVGEVIDQIPYKTVANAMKVLKKDNSVRRMSNDTRRADLYAEKED